MESLTRGTHWSVRHEQSSGAVRRWRGQSSPTARLLAVTSSPSDLLDLAHLSHHLAGPIVDAKHGGSIHGGTAEPDNGATPVEATTKH